MDSLKAPTTRTRQALADALVTLALEQGYDSLTIRAVTKRANVGYATFFRHFKSLDELLAHTMAHTFQDLTGRIERQTTVYNEVVAEYSFVKDHPKFYRFYLNLPSTHPARQIATAEAEKLIRARCEPRLPTHVPLDMSVQHIHETSNRLILWYLDHLDECSMDQVVAMHYDLVINGTQNVVLLHAGSSNPPQAKALARTIHPREPRHVDHMLARGGNSDLTKPARKR